MPWKPGDASRHIRKAKSPTSRKQWSEVANSALRRGASEDSAIRQANAAVRKRGQRGR